MAASTGPAETIKRAKELGEILDTIHPHQGDIESLFASTTAPWKFQSEMSPQGAAVSAALLSVEESLPVQRLVDHHAPTRLLMAETAAAAYRGFKGALSPENTIVRPEVWMSVQDEIFEGLGLDSDLKRDFRYWSRVARMHDIVEKHFECGAASIGFTKLVSEGRPPMYVGEDRDKTAELSGLYLKTLSDQFIKMCVMFACDTSNVDTYRAFIKQGGNVDRFGVVTHIDEYDLTNIPLAPELTAETYPESFVYVMRRIWNEMGIPEEMRLEIDGLGDDPKRVADALRNFYDVLASKRIWSHLILGLGPEERPHIIFLDDLGDPPEYFGRVDHVELSSYVQERDISRGQQPHSHAISLGGFEALAQCSMQQTFFVDANSGDPSKARGLVKALSEFPPHRNHSVALCQFAPSRWKFFTDAVSAQVIEDSGLYHRV